MLSSSPVQKAELPLYCANTIPKIQTEIYPSSPKWRSTFFLLALLLWEMTQGRIQEGGEHLGAGSEVSFLLLPGLFQPCSGERSTQHPLHIHWGSSGLAYQCRNKMPCLVSRLQQSGSILTQLHPSLKKLEKGFLQHFLADRSTARKGVSIPCVLVQLCTAEQPDVVWAAKTLLASAWDLTAPGKTCLAAGPALGSCYGLDQLRSFGGARNCSLKNLRKEQLVNAQTGSWPWHLN